MILSLHVRSGGLAGRTFHFREGPVRIGRRPDLELPLDPERDRAASALHAEVSRGPGGWVIRDLESRNGTWVDGRKIAGPTPLRNHSRVCFGGQGGPEVEVALQGGASETTGAAVRETRILRGAVVLLGVALVAVAGTFAVRSGLREQGWEEERRRLLAATDSALQVAAATPAREGSGEGEAESLREVVDELSRALERSRAELSALRDALARAEAPASGSDSGEVEELRRRLQQATAALERQQMASSLDFPAILGANGRAVALLYIESAGGALTTGTGFGVRADGVLLTARHLLLPRTDSPPPVRIGVQFAQSDQVFPARLLASSPDHDLAAIRVENISGDIPTVRGFNTRADTLGTGAPLATLGFPLGGEVGTGAGVARPLLTAGVLSRIGPETLEVQGYGEEGASGSPVFDAGGHVLGVLYGGRPEGGSRVLLIVNGARTAAFLSQVP